MWYFNVDSEMYGDEQFGPYDSEQEANAAIRRVQSHVEQAPDGVRRYYSLPYQQED